MAHLFETGVFTDNLPAWHGLGIVVPDEHLTLERAFELLPEVASPVVQSNSLFGSYETDGNLQIADTAGWVMNVRSLDNRCVGVVSSTWELVQNSELFELGEGIVEEGGRWKTMGSLKDGRICWGLLEIPTAAIAGEEYVRHLLLVNSFDGSMGMRACSTDTRVVCWNTLSWAIEGTKRSYTIRHTRNAMERLHEAKEALGIAYDRTEHLKVVSERLATEAMSAARGKKLIAQLVPYTPEAEVSDVMRRNLDAKRENLYFLWKNSPNLEGIRNTALGLVQAASEWEQHYGYNRTSEATFTRFMVDGNQPLAARAMSVVREAVGV